MSTDDGMTASPFGLSGDKITRDVTDSKYTLRRVKDRCLAGCHNQRTTSIKTSRNLLTSVKMFKIFCFLDMIKYLYLSILQIFNYLMEYSFSFSLFPSLFFLLFLYKPQVQNIRKRLTVKIIEKH